MSNLLKYIALATCLAAVAMRLATYVPDSRLTPSVAMALLLPAFVVGFAAFGSLWWSCLCFPVQLPKENFIDYLIRSNAGMREAWGVRLSLVPRAAKVIFMLTLVYVVVSAIIAGVSHGNGAARRHADGTYWLTWKHKAPAPITKTEFHACQSREARFVSGILLLFALAGYLHFQYIQPQLLQLERYSKSGIGLFATRSNSSLLITKQKVTGS